MLPRYYAEKELLESGINSLPITTEQIEAVITGKGFKIINYDTSCKQHAEILTDLGVLPLANRTKAFTYVGNTEKIVFVKISVSANEKRLLLAHELGHIAMGHFSNDIIKAYTPWGLIDCGQEDEANSFALEFLAPICILKKLYVKSPQKIKDIALIDDKFINIIRDNIKACSSLSDIGAVIYKRFKMQRASNIARACVRGNLNKT